jgi:glycosyltransferase involved in cell wall biosynthesis
MSAQAIDLSSAADQTTDPPSEPGVTWLLPVRNGLPFLPQTLASIAAQTYKNHKVLARDDGSTDETLAELQRWIPSRIPGRVFSGPSLGLGRSLAFLVEQAETELCARIDGDDINYPDRLQRQVAFLESHPSVGILGGQSDFIDENGASVAGWEFPCDDATLRWRARWQPSFMHPNVMFRRSVILQAGNYRDLQPYEDTELWMRAAEITGFANLPDRLIQYRRSSQSQTGRMVDFKAIFREAAKLSVSLLFPGVPAHELMDFWDATHPFRLYSDEWPPSLPFRYLRYLERAAVLLARRANKPDAYFTATELFAAQKFHLKRVWMERHGLGPLRRMRVWLAGRS